MINACKLASAESITVLQPDMVSLTGVQVVTPYFPYSKGDQKTHRSPITSKLVANIDVCVMDAAGGGAGPGRDNIIISGES